MSYFSINDVPLGTCKNCKNSQTIKGSGGYFVNGQKQNWYCKPCFRSKNIRSLPLACEWCTFDNITHFQGHTYDCQRCQELSIGQHKKK